MSRDGTLGSGLSAVVGLVARLWQECFEFCLVHVRFQSLHAIGVERSFSVISRGLSFVHIQLSVTCGYTEAHAPLSFELCVFEEGCLSLVGRDIDLLVLNSCSPFTSYPDGGGHVFQNVEVLGFESQGDCCEQG